MTVRVLLAMLVAFGAAIGTGTAADAVGIPTLAIVASTNAIHVTGVSGCPYKKVDERDDGTATVRLSTTAAVPVAVNYLVGGDTGNWMITPPPGTQIPAGKRTLTIRMRPRSDRASTATLTLRAGAYTIGTPSDATVYLMRAISDPPSCPQRPPSIWPHQVAGGFPTTSGTGFALVFRDGAVAGHRGFHHAGDETQLSLGAPVVGGSITANDRGYRLVAADGGVFSFGSARFYGSLGGLRLNAPVVGIASSPTGKGYWLAAADGGVFAFGDARFFGSTGALSLRQPIVAIASGGSGRGYRLVARDGGIFDFGAARFHGSLPSRGINATDVVGIAPTPTNAGYWIARRNGRVDAFGDAPAFGSYRRAACDPVAAIFSNPSAPGYRIVTRSGATIPFGNAPGGNHPTGNAARCPGTPPPAAITHQWSRSPSPNAAGQRSLS